MKRLVALICFMLFYTVDVIRSNFRVAYDVMTPKDYMKPGIIAVDVAGMTERQLWFMANLLTMTPGTLGVAISKDLQILYIHAMYIVGTPEAMAEKLAATYGRRVRDVF